MADDRFDPYRSFSASSSTLIVTPNPLLNTKGDGEDSNNHVYGYKRNQNAGTRSQGVPMVISMRSAAAMYQQNTGTAVTPPTRMSGRGFIEPHYSHLPRRARRKADVSAPAPVPPAPPADTNTNNNNENEEENKRARSNSFDTNKTEGGLSVPRDDQGTPPTNANPNKGLDTPQKTKPGPGPLQPHISHLPRRHTRKPVSAASRLERRLCLQEVGCGSGVFVGVSERRWRGEMRCRRRSSGSASGSEPEGEEEEPDDKEESVLRERYCAIVRLVVAPPTTNDDHDNHDNVNDDIRSPVLRLSLPNAEPAEAGYTQLTPSQIRRGCSFLHKHHITSTSSPSSSSSSPPSSTTNDKDRRPTLILAPPLCAVDAFALAVCYYGGTTLPSHPSKVVTRRPESPGVPSSAGSWGCASPAYSSASEGGTSSAPHATTTDSPLLPTDNNDNAINDNDDTYTPLHTLIMKLHDEDLAVFEDEDGGKRAGRGELRAGKGGLGDTWRGLVRWEGVMALDGVWCGC